MLENFMRTEIKRSSVLLRREISVPRLHHQLFLFRGHMQLVISRSRVFIRRVTQTVLIPQFLFNLRVNLFNGLFLRNLEQSPTGLFRNLLQYFFPINPLFLGTSSSTPPRSKRPHRNRPVAKSLAVLEQN